MNAVCINNHHHPHPSFLLALPLFRGTNVGGEAGSLRPCPPEVARPDIYSPPPLKIGIKLDSRCRLLPETDSRRGKIAYIGPVPEIPGLAAPWIGIVLDEPTGKNDGSVQGKRYFSCGAKCGVFVRPERVEAGEFAVLDEFGSDEEF